MAYLPAFSPSENSGVSSDKSMSNVRPDDLSCWWNALSASEMEGRWL